MTTKAMRKNVAELATAKGRKRSGWFMAEGTKCVLDTIEHFDVVHVFATEQWLKEHPLPAAAAAVAEACTRGELGEMSSMVLTPDVIAVYRQPLSIAFNPHALRGRITVALDRVQDPGNLGTIMRSADWMGVDTILASTDTVDCFNPKVVQASMGAIARVRVIYGELPQMLAQAAEQHVAVCGTFLGGENVYTAALPQSAVVVMGNEGSGISPQVARLVSRRLLIPSYPPERPTSESLNVATATAIILSQFIARRYGQS